MSRFTKLRLVVFLVLLSLCVLPVQAFASADLVVTKKAIYDMGNDLYRCVVNIKNYGSSVTSATDLVEVTLNGMPYSSMNLSTMALPGNYETDAYVDVTLQALDPRPSTIVGTFRSTTLEYAQQAITFSTGDAVAPPSSSSGGCSTGVAGVAGLMALAGAALCRRRRG